MFISGKDSFCSKTEKNSEMGLQRQIQLQEVIKNDKNNNNKKTRGP